MYLRTRPSSCLGIWFAFDDATVDNGGMWGIPESHKNPTTCFFKRKVENGQETVYYDPPEKPIYNLENPVPMEAKKGDIILLHGDFVHFSKDNHSPLQRHAYTLHIVESRNHFWEEDNWIVRRDIPFRFLNEHKTSLRI
jgi:phytanoyl-CoA hydroxylase